jgi:hypothetical protein
MESTAGSFRVLMTAVVSRALADLEKDRAAIRTSDHIRDEAMRWLNGRECEAFCYALDMDYRAIWERGAALYLRFLEAADGCGKAPRPRTRSPSGLKTSNTGSAVNQRKA